MKIKKVIIFCIFLGSTFFIYHNWFMSKEIIGGDWPFYYQEAVNMFSPLPPVWSGVHGNGLGGKIIFYSVDTYLYFPGWFFSKILHIPWDMVYKVFWFGGFLILGFCSSFFLLKRIFPQSPLWQQILGVFIYLANTYILMMTSGGQMGPALAYAFAPFILLKYMDLLAIINKRSINFDLVQNTIAAGVLLAIQMFFDPRDVYLMLLIIGVYFLFNYNYRLPNKRVTHFFLSLVFLFLIPLLIVGLLHAFWILPLFFVGNSSIDQLGSAYTTSSAVKFFSFAKFENTISLLHPFWPENIFGKTAFMRPEFILLPFFAYISLLFTKSRKVLFFALLGLLGAFLAKGANDPLGGLYLWFFDHIPGFVVFRDPTKFYLLISLSYAVLVPFSIYSCFSWFIKKKKRYLASGFLFLVLLYFFILALPAFNGTITGTFQKRSTPQDYIALKNKLSNDSHFYRILWFPREERFAYVTNMHPAVEASALFAVPDQDLTKKIFAQGTQKYLSDLGIRYIIVPYDPYGEIFIEDRKYSQKKRDAVEQTLDKISWLKKIQKDKITIYENISYKDHFYTNDNEKISFVMHSSEDYDVTRKLQKPTKLIFAENFSNHWKVKFNGSVINSIKTNEGLNSFELPKNAQKVHIYNDEVNYYTYGLYISGITVLLLIGISLYKLKNFW